MPQLYTPLSVDECIRILREQVLPLGFFARIKMLRPRTSSVLGKIRGHTFVLETSKDPYSKRFVGSLMNDSEHTIIPYEWKRSLFPRPLFARLLGYGRFDEEETLSFLQTWLKAEPV